jgi:hypothetical protein
LALFIVAFFQWLGYFFGHAHPIFYTLLLLISLAYSYLRRNGEVAREMRKMEQGLAGEITVGNEIEELRAMDFEPFHDIPSFGRDGHTTNIDHVIVGKKGIFTIETKTLSRHPGDSLRYENGSFWLSGQSVSLVQPRAESHFIQVQVKKRLGKSFSVQAIMLFPGLRVDPVATAQAKSEGVLLLSSKALPSFLKNYPEILTKEDVILVSDFLKNMPWVGVTKHRTV